MGEKMRGKIFPEQRLGNGFEVSKNVYLGEIATVKATNSFISIKIFKFEPKNIRPEHGSIYCCKKKPKFQKAVHENCEHFASIYNRDI